MNSYMRTLSLLTLALCAFKAQAYQFTVTNLTPQTHTAHMMLLFPFENWRDMTIRPDEVKGISFPPGDTLGGVWLEKFAIDKNEMDIIGVTQNQLKQMKAINNNKRIENKITLADYMKENSFYVANQTTDMDIYIFETADGLIAVTPSRLDIALTIKK